MIYKVGDEIPYWELHWQSDWNGDEVGYPEVPVVGFYTDPDNEIDLYIDVENATILEVLYPEDYE